MITLSSCGSILVGQASSNIAPIINDNLAHTDTDVWQFLCSLQVCVFLSIAERISTMAVQTGSSMDYGTKFNFVLHNFVN